MSSLNATPNKKPNPQGKGCVPVLQDLYALQATAPVAKPARQILRDFCISSIVLGARFRFKPVPGKPYFLYCSGGDWSLSLISPQEWGHRRPGDFVGRCTLHTDMCWQLEMPQLPSGHPASQHLETFVEAFSTYLQSHESITDCLPFYARHLPYYQRLLGTGVATSLAHSISALERDNPVSLIDAARSSSSTP
jgi:hypothetical protein